LKKYFILFKILFQVALEHRANIISNLLMHLLGLGVFYFVWSKILAGGASIESYDFNSIVSYYMTSGLFIAFFNTRTTKSMEKMIKDGKLSNLLVKPINEFLYVFFQELGKRIVVIILTTIIFLPPLILIPNIRNTINFSLGAIFWTTLFSILSNLFLFTFFFSIGCLAFWFKSTSGFRNITGNLLSILKGAWFPIDIAPTFLQNIFSILPFQYTRYFLIKIIISDIPKSLYIKGLGVIIIYTLLFTSISLVLWKKGLKKYESVGI